MQGLASGQETRAGASGVDEIGSKPWPYMAAADSILGSHETNNSNNMLKHKQIMLKLGTDIHVCKSYYLLQQQYEQEDAMWRVMCACTV
jgi:hypothetical protein